MLWRKSEHDVLAGEAWDESRARGAIEEIVADVERTCSDGFWPAHDDDEVTAAPVCSLYLGSAGMLWGLMRLGSEIDAAPIAERLLEVYRKTPDFEDDPDEGAHPASLLMGETGLIMTSARAGSRVSHLTRLRALIEQNRENPMRELLYGSAGTTLAARAAGLEDCWRESAAWLLSEWDLETHLWTQSFASQEAQYLGAAHGFAGNVNALRGYVDDALLGERLERLLTATALREGDLVNWAPTVRSPPEAIRVQWCHGAPGIVAMLGDLMPLELAEAAGELTWRAGPLHKGAGLCLAPPGTAMPYFNFLR
jgi:hypothetical protein